MPLWWNQLQIFQRKYENGSTRVTFMSYLFMFNICSVSVLFVWVWSSRSKGTSSWHGSFTISNNLLPPSQHNGLLFRIIYQFFPTASTVSCKNASCNASIITNIEVLPLVVWKDFNLFSPLSWLGAQSLLLGKRIYFYYRVARLVATDIINNRFETFCILRWRSWIDFVFETQCRLRRVVIFRLRICDKTYDKQGPKNRVKFVFVLKEF